MNGLYTINVSTFLNSRRASRMVESPPRTQPTISGTIERTAGARLNVTNIDRETPLHKAAVKGHVEAVKVLIDAGANVCLTSIGNGFGISNTKTDLWWKIRDAQYARCN